MFCGSFWGFISGCRGFSKGCFGGPKCENCPMKMPSVKDLQITTQKTLHIVQIHRPQIYFGTKTSKIKRLPIQTYETCNFLFDK